MDAVKGETIVSGMSHDSPISDALEVLKKQFPPHNLGELGNAIVQVSNMDLTGLEQT